jgi:hypothetical protein
MFSRNAMHDHLQSLRAGSPDIKPSVTPSPSHSKA